MNPKKLLFTTILMVLAISLPAWALEPLSDWDMRQVIGQAQIDIHIEELSVAFEIDEVTYTDTDGTDGTPATVFVKDISVSRTFHAIYDVTDQNGALMFAYGDEDLLGSHALKPGDFSPISIKSVDRAPILSAMNMYNQVGTSPMSDTLIPLTADYAVSGLAIDLPTIEVVTHSETFTVGIRKENAINNNKTFISVERGESVMAVLGGYVEVAAH